MNIRPIDIARKLKVSTSALRHYEDWGIVPAVERGANGYRQYTDLHVAYFECIRALAEGFGMQTASKMMKEIIRGRSAEALWLMSEAQAALYEDKMIAEKTIRALESEDIPLTAPPKKEKKGMTIGEISARTTIPGSAIRHWEKMGLLVIARDSENGYRVFSHANLRQILIIRTLKSAVWSLDIIKRIIKELDENNVANAIATAREAIGYLNRMIRLQLRGAARLQALLDKIETNAAARS